MISIGRKPDHLPQFPVPGDLQECPGLLRRLLQEGITVRRQWGREISTSEFELSARELMRRLDAQPSPHDLALIATAAAENIESRTREAVEYFRAQSSQIQSMLAMLVETVADISAHSDACVARLQAVEQQIERASSLDDLRSLRNTLADCLAAVREAAGQQKKAGQAAVDRLQVRIDTVSQPASQSSGPAYVVAFKLQRADHIITRFGAVTAQAMRTMIGEVLQGSLGPHERLERWKHSAFLMFLDSSDNLASIRRRVAGIVAKIGQRYVEVGKNSALLAVGVDWVVFPQAQYPSLDDILREVDSFLGKQAA